MGNSEIHRNRQLGPALFRQQSGPTVVLPQFPGGKKARFKKAAQAGALIVTPATARSPQLTSDQAAIVAGHEFAEAVDQDIKKIYAALADGEISFQPTRRFSSRRR